MKRKILNRYKDGKLTIRTLECGHEQWENPGGKAHLAEFARCKSCASKVDAPRHTCRICAGPADCSVCDSCWLNSPSKAEAPTHAEAQAFH